MQIKQYIHANNQGIIIFPKEYYQLKKNNGNFI